jgi:DNA invertase Pin-like site-specific DNA recombinase
LHKAGLQAAKKRGKYLGRPPRLSREQINHAKNMIRSGQETMSGMVALYGVNRTTLYRALKR